jgi:hypothetical protein
MDSSDDSSQNDSEVMDVSHAGIEQSPFDNLFPRGMA